MSWLIEYCDYRLNTCLFIYSCFRNAFLTATYQTRIDTKTDVVALLFLKAFGIGCSIFPREVAPKGDMRLSVNGQRCLKCMSEWFTRDLYFPSLRLESEFFIWEHYEWHRVFYDLMSSRGSHSQTAQVGYHTKNIFALTKHSDRFFFRVGTVYLHDLVTTYM